MVLHVFLHSSYLLTLSYNRKNCGKYLHRFAHFKILKYIYTMQEQIAKINFQPVADYATIKGITVQAVYQRIKSNKVLVKKIGTYTLVADK